MIWPIAVAVILALFGGLWWLERPLWHRARDLSALDRFLSHLVSPGFPGRSMVVTASGREVLRAERAHAAGAGFGLALRSCPIDLPTAEELVARLRSLGLSRVDVHMERSEERSVVVAGLPPAFDPQERLEVVRCLLRGAGVEEEGALKVRYVDRDLAVMRARLQRGATGPYALGRAVARWGLRRLKG